MSAEINPSFRDILSEFYSKLGIPSDIPEDVEVLNPYTSKKTCVLIEQFFNKYYSDQKGRILLIGINPGRFGGGLTGIGFTDPINLEDKCDIENDLEKKNELSSIFMYAMIEEYGGPRKFFSKYLFTSVSPLGFIRDGKNVNYYDIPGLKNSLEKFMVESLVQQINLGGSRELAYSIGMGENIKYLKYLNKKYQLFKQINALPHPRWIMQYRRKKMREFVKTYVKTLNSH